MCYPLWEQAIRVEPAVRTVDEAAIEPRRSWLATTRLLDARLVTGEMTLFGELEARMQPWRRDRESLRHRLRSDAVHRHAIHPSAAASATPDLVVGRGGLLDIQALRWLDYDLNERSLAALDFLLASLSRVEDAVGHTPHHLSARILERVDPDGVLLRELYPHARWIAFMLDGAFAPARDDRALGASLALHRGMLVAERLPPLERVPSLGLRVANLAGLAPPSDALLVWSSESGAPLSWDEPSVEQLWLLLRAADWRAWDFLDVTGLLLRYLPELQRIWHQPGSTRTGGLASDTHSFLALRSLHEWTESDDPFARRAWRWVRHRDWVYLAVLLHELGTESIRSVADRLRLTEPARDSLQLAVDTYQLVIDTATRRDLHDEDLLLDLATRIGDRRLLGVVFLVAIAHELANGAPSWSPWKADLLRQLFGQLELALGERREVGSRRTRSLEQHRTRIVRELERRELARLAPLVARLPRRYVLTRTPAFAARHLALLASGALAEGEVRIDARRRRTPGVWDVLIVARDRPGLLAMVAGVLALRGASVLGADAATSSDGLVLDVFTVSGPDAALWPVIERDLKLALEGRIPLHDLLGSRPMEPEDVAAVNVSVDNTASQFFSVVEVRAHDQVGLLYRIASALHAEQLDIHHARIVTNPEGALDVFYVRDLNGQKLTDDTAFAITASLTRRLRGDL